MKTGMIRNCWIIQNNNKNNNNKNKSMGKENKNKNKDRKKSIKKISNRIMLTIPV